MKGDIRQTEKTYLESLDVLNLGELLPIGDAGLEEAGRHADADRLRGHAGGGGLGGVGNCPEGAKEEDQQVLRDHRQREEDPEEKKKKKCRSLEKLVNADDDDDKADDIITEHQKNHNHTHKQANSGEHQKHQT